jgi:hypothetical protein
LNRAQQCRRQKRAIDGWVELDHLGHVLDVLENPREVVGQNFLYVSKGALDGQVCARHSADMDILLLHFAHHGTHQRNAKHSRRSTIDILAESLHNQSTLTHFIVGARDVHRSVKKRVIFLDALQNPASSNPTR